MRRMRIAAVQMVSTPDVARNLQAATRLVAEAAAVGAELALSSSVGRGTVATIQLPPCPAVRAVAS